MLCGAGDLDQATQVVAYESRNIVFVPLRNKLNFIIQMNGSRPHIDTYVRRYIERAIYDTKHYYGLVVSCIVVEADLANNVTGQAKAGQFL